MKRRDPFELGYLEGNIPGRGGEVAGVMTAAIALALLVALVSGRLGQLLRLYFQQFLEDLLYAASYQLFVLTLDYYSSLSCIRSSRTWFAISFQNGVSQLHSTKDLQTMSLFI